MHPYIHDRHSERFTAGCSSTLAASCRAAGEQLARHSMAAHSSSVLASAGGSYVSQSGLAKILKEVRDGGLPKAVSRSSVKRARDAALPKTLWAEVQLLRDDGTTCKSPALNPWRLLEWTVQQAPPFKDFLLQTLAKHPNDAAHPWGICIYSDEILPGAALKPRNDRKLISFYRVQPWPFLRRRMDAFSIHTCKRRERRKGWLGPALQAGSTSFLQDRPGRCQWSELGFGARIPSHSFCSHFHRDR